MSTTTRDDFDLKAVMDDVERREMERLREKEKPLIILTVIAGVVFLGSMLAPFLFG